MQTKQYHIPQSVKKKLLFGEVLTEELARNINNSSDRKSKEIIHKVVSGQLMKKYRLIGEARRLISYKTHKKLRCNLKLTQYERRKRNTDVTRKITEKIRQFLERDEHSKMCPGKKDYITRRKIKKQERILLDTLHNLHTKFSTEFNTTISFATFCRLRKKIGGVKL